MQGKNDPENYRRMSEPFETDKQADEALEKFFTAVEFARNEYHIADVHVLVKINIMQGEKEGQAMTSCHLGNSLNAALMCAWGLGQEQSNQENLIREYLKSK